MLFGLFVIKLCLELEFSVSPVFRVCVRDIEESRRVGGNSEFSV